MNCFDQMADDALGWVTERRDRGEMGDPVFLKLAHEELTPREIEVVTLVAEGKTTHEIAIILGVSAKTIDCHRFRIHNRLGIHNVVELTKYALRNGLVSL
jgi:DNA-binding NarL/FixJ family response regulator